MSIPSQVALALLDGVADANGKDYAMSLCDSAAASARRVIDDILVAHGNDSLYVMQVVGEVMLATVQDIVQKVIDQRKH